MRIAVPAENTIGSVLFQMGVVILRQLVPGHSKVILLSNVQAHRAWLAMVAVNAHILRCKDSQNGIVFSCSATLQMPRCNSSRLRMPGRTVVASEFIQDICRHWYCLSAQPKGEIVWFNSWPRSNGSYSLRFYSMLESHSFLSFSVTLLNILPGSHVASLEQSGFKISRVFPRSLPPEVANGTMVFPEKS